MSDGKKRSAKAAKTAIMAKTKAKAKIQAETAANSRTKAKIVMAKKPKTARAAHTAKRGASVAAAGPRRRFDPLPLFAERLAAYWVAVWKCWRTVLDWTVWLYILVPAVWIVSGIYIDWARHPPVWMAELPVAVPLAFVGLTQLVGALRTFADPGDALFLHRNGKWRRGLAAWACVYGASGRLLSAVLTCALLAPTMLTGGKISAAGLIAAAAWLALAGCVWMLAKDFIRRRLSGWSKWLAWTAGVPAALLALAGGAAAVADSPLRLAALAPVAAAAAVWLTAARIRAVGTLLTELAVERSAYTSAVGWMLMETFEKKPLPRLRRPLLFKRSQPLLRKRGGAAGRMADNWLKSTLRRSDQLRPIVYMTGVGLSALLLTPPLLSAGVLLVLPFVLLGCCSGSGSPG